MRSNCSLIELIGGRDQHLADVRLRCAGGVADLAVVDGHVAPPDHLLAFGGHRLLDQLLDLKAPFGIGREEADADAVAPGARQLDARGGAAEERIGDLQQDSGAVTGVRIGALGAAMLQVAERLEALLDDCVRGLAPELGDQRDAACVVLG